MTQEEIEALKTDKERFEALNQIPYGDWPIVADWARETTDEHYKQIFHSTARSMYHTEEYYAGAL